MAPKLNRRHALFAGLAAVSVSEAAFAQGAPSALSARDAHDRARAGKLLLIDIRAPDEVRDTGLPLGAIALDADSAGFEVRLAGLRVEHRGKTIALIDRTGALAASTVQKLAGRGWRDLVAVRGGMLGQDGWLAQALPVTP